MAESIVTYFLEKLHLLISEQTSVLGGLDEQVRLLRDELELIRSFLRDADDKRKTNERVKEWVRQVREVVYEAEDVIDIFILKTEQLRQRNIGFRYIFYPNQLIILRKLGKQIEVINRKIETISINKSKYGIEILETSGHSNQGQPWERRRDRGPIVEELDVVGFQNEATELATLLTREETRELVVVSIVGMGGLGKTTLAKKVYNRYDVKTHFDSYAWVYVSQEYRIRDLLQEIIKQVKGLTYEEKKNLENMDEEELGKMLSDNLKHRKYLIVLDDLWRKSDWDKLKLDLPAPDEGKQSRVLLTTRNEEVARHADPLSNPHRLRFLDENESLKLFLKKVFSVPQDSAIRSCPKELEDLGKKMVSKCGGLPLALLVLGGLLSTKDKTPYVWFKVLESANWQLNQDPKDCLGVLYLSYIDLPYYLKSCFMYFGLFPEDFVINCRRLIRLWVAEGFIQQRGEETMEDVAEDCLEELIQRSMIQAVDRRSNRGAELCRIHDLLRDLAISEAKQCKFLDIYGNESFVSPNITRRLSINLNSAANYHTRSSTRHYSMYHLRSLLCYNERLQGSFYGGFKLLRVLELTNARNVSTLPKEIGQLVLIKYMALRRTRIQSLPCSVGNLYNLQTIDFQSTLINHAPNVIWKLQQLRHILISECSVDRRRITCGITWSSRPPRIDRLRDLQTLRLPAGSWIEGGLYKLTNLRLLKIDGGIDLYQKTLSSSIAKLIRLQVLYLTNVPFDNPTSLPLISLPHHVHMYEMNLVGKLESLLQPHDFPPNLTELNLEYSDLKPDDDPMVTLEQLPNLRVLKMEDVFRGKKMICSAGGFPGLQVLQLGKLSYLEDWIVEQGALPILRDLGIYGTGLKILPDGLRHLTGLKTLGVTNFPKDRIQEGVGEDWDKIKHIPSVTCL